MNQGLVETLACVVDAYSEQSLEENPFVDYTLAILRFFLGAIQLAPEGFTSEDLLEGLDRLGRANDDKTEKNRIIYRRTVLRELSGHLFKLLEERPLQGDLNRCIIFWQNMSERVYQIAHTATKNKDLLLGVVRHLRRELMELVNEQRRLAH